MGTLLLPLRMSLYGLRKELRARKPPIAAPRHTRESAPAFSTRVHTIFCDSKRIEKPGIPLDGLFAEVESQLRGAYRLAGGRVHRLDLANWDGLEDAEDHHAYHRLYWAVRYAEAAFFGHEGARNGLVGELSSWLDGRWEGSPVASWPYTVAERIASLTTILFWIGDGGNGLSSSLTVPIKRQIWNDANQLSSSVEYGLGLHNHLLNDARGLFLASAALADCDHAAGWREQAWTIWDECFPKLVLEDGTFAEQSSHYHLLLCRTALEYWVACRRAQRPLPQGFEGRLLAMFDLANELVRPDGSLPRFGDNSPDRTGTDLWGLLPAAYHYGLLRRPPRHRAITPLTLFYCAVRPVLPEVEDVAGLRLFPNGGIAILRSATSAAELVAHGDGRDGVGPHGDAGRGSYELWWKGHVLVREPGCFSSPSDANWRSYQCAEAQNVTSLDGLPPVITKQDGRFLARWYRPQGGAWSTLPGIGAEFRCEAFSRLHPDIVVFRTWQFEKPDALMFHERIEGSARVSFESRICLGDAPWGTFERAGVPGTVTLHWQGDDGSSVEMTISAPLNIAMDIQPCTFLPEYGVEKKGRVILLAGSQRLPFSWTVRWKFNEANN